MRLEPSEISGIKQVIGHFITEGCYQLYLFGSRADPKKKGGDIDLLLVLNNNLPKKSLTGNKYKILVEIKELIGEQKIDLVIAEEEELSEDPFLREITKTAIKL